MKSNPESPATKVVRAARKGVTLIEMLISVTLTLLVVFALVQIFQVLGDTVSLGRATIELSGQLRSVAHRLQADLDNTTCAIMPRQDPGASPGYFLYIEGAASDSINLSGATWDQQAQFGDNDDLLAMTVRSTGKPFKGSYWGLVGGTATLLGAESPVAEVVWWIATIDSNGNGIADVGETRVLMRRQFLVSPVSSVDQSQIVASAVIDPQTLVSGALTEAYYTTEIALHLDASGSMALSSLSDLSKPGSRALSYYGLSRMAAPYIAGTEPPGVPQGGRLPVNYQSAGNLALGVGFHPGFPSLIGPDDFGSYDSDPDGVPDLGEYVNSVVATDIAAFDVRIFDPRAPVLQSDATPGNRHLPASPGDPYFALAQSSGDLKTMVLTNSRNQTTGQIPQPLNPHVVGRGAYVDLGYMVNRRQLFSATLSEIASIGFDLSTAQPGGRVSTFSGLPAFVDDGNGILESGENFFYPSLPLSGVAGGAYQMGVDDGNTTVDTDEHLLLAYDTWSVSFESDGVDQDGDSVIDQASDGIDNDGVNGVDDVGELESPAPYDMPLNGMEVKIRMWHVGTGQVRQVSVVTDFSSAP